MIEVTIIIVWALCGFLHYGLHVGYFYYQFPLIGEDMLKQSRIRAAFFAPTGPLALFATVVTCYPFHWKL